jgi:amidase
MMLRACLIGVLLLAGMAGAEAPRESSTSAAPAIATVTQLNKAFDAGTLTSEELVRLLEARIDAYDDAGPRLNALLSINPRAASRHSRRGQGQHPPSW